MWPGLLGRALGPLFLWGEMGQFNKRNSSGLTPVVFVFPGQGGQWPGMAAELLERSPRFERHMAACEEALRPFVDWSLSETMREGGEDSLARLDVVQPA